MEQYNLHREDWMLSIIVEAEYKYKIGLEG